eukprot:1161902-Pelagomonas_calceolata.AAC.4
MPMMPGKLLYLVQAHIGKCEPPILVITPFLEHTQMGRDACLIRGVMCRVGSSDKPCVTPFSFECALQQHLRALRPAGRMPLAMPQFASLEVPTPYSGAHECAVHTCSAAMLF